MSTNSVQNRPPRILLTKIGLDGHDRGSRLVATFLRDAGMEVIYTGPWQKIPAVISLAMQEDVDVIGISSLATDHLIIPRLMTALRDAEMENVEVIVGGIVPDNEADMLIEAGVAHIFHPGASRDEIINRVSELVDRVRAVEAGADR